MSIVEDVQRLAAPLRSEADLDPLMERIGDAPFVLLGEASHGTHEFYQWRAAITRRLIREKGFSFVAVEGDWPDCYEVHRSVTLAPGAAEDPADALADFDRWPTWMWANEDVMQFTRWLREHNHRRPFGRRVGFFGLDVYSLWESLRAVLEYMEKNEPEHVEEARLALNCFEPYAEDPRAYARSTRLVPAHCEEHVVSLLKGIAQRNAARFDTDGSGFESRAAHPAFGSDDHRRLHLEREARFDAEQNAEVVVGAEAYYRAMLGGGPGSWNLRDRHMARTLDKLVRLHQDQDGDEPVKAVVWAHNSHIGDARYTDMSSAGMVNVAQLVRNTHGERNVVLVGFGTYSGTVTAAREWGEQTETMAVPEARPGSTEALMHSAVPNPAAMFVFPSELPDWLREVRDHRAIGVVYHPDAERWGNYVETVLGRRYDAFCWIDRTQALSPLVPTHAVSGELETWPYGR